MNITAQTCAQICQNMAVIYTRLSDRARCSKRFSDANLYSDWAGGAMVCAREIEATFNLKIKRPKLAETINQTDSCSRRQGAARG